MKLKFTGKVKETGLHIYNRRQFDSNINIFLNKDVVITIERKKRKRSLSQNAYLHGVVIPMVKVGYYDIGYRYSIEETKTDLKRMFAVYEKVNHETGEIREYIKDTSDMTTSEMMDFIAQIQEWASEFLNIVIPDPGQQVNIEFNN